MVSSGGINHWALSGGLNQDKWTDLCENHIVRAASIYANVPKNNAREINAMLKKAERGVLSSHRGNQLDSAGLASTKNASKKQSLQNNQPSSPTAASDKTLGENNGISEAEMQLGQVREALLWAYQPYSKVGPKNNKKSSNGSFQGRLEANIQHPNETESDKNSHVQPVEIQKSDDIHYSSKHITAERTTGQRLLMPGFLSSDEDDEEYLKTHNQDLQIGGKEVGKSLNRSEQADFADDEETPVTTQDLPYCSQSAEFYLRESAKAAYFGGASDQVTQCLTAPSPAFARQGYHQEASGSKEKKKAREPDILSPKEQRQNQKSTKQTAQSVKRKDKTINKSQTSKNVQKKINELGSVYETKIATVPGVNGAMVRTSNQDFRIVNGLAGRAVNKRKTEDLSRKRIVSQSPSMVYSEQDGRDNQLVAIAHKTQNPRRERSDRNYLYNKNFGKEDMQTSQKMLVKGQSSSRSKNSLPDINNHNRSSLNESGLDQINYEAVSQKFYPAQEGESRESVQKLMKAQHDISRDHAHEITISDDNIALVSFNMSSIDHLAVNENSNIDISKTYQPISLPKIAEKSKKAVPSRIKQSFGPVLGSQNQNALGGGVNNFGLIQRTQSVPKSSASIEQAKQTPGNRKKLIDQIKTSELAPTIHESEEKDFSETTLTPRTETNAGICVNQKRSSGLSNVLQPLTHTPILKKGQALPLHSTALNSIDIPESTQKMQRKKQNNVKNPQKNLILTTEGEKNGQRPELSPEFRSIQSPKANEKDRQLIKPEKSPLRGPPPERVPGQNMTMYGGNRFGQKDFRDSTIIAQSLNAEPYYRRAIKKLGWNQVPQDANKINFHIRFNISDLEGSSKDLQPRHFYNHFPQNRELVTKMGLCKNLWFNCFTEQEHLISSIFPRCYDLSVPQQVETFINDFNQTAILSIIKIVATHFIQKNKDIPKLLEHYSHISDFVSPNKFFKPDLRRKCQAMDMRSSAMGNLLGVSEIRDAYSFSKAFCNSLQFKEPKKPGMYRASLMKLCESQIQAMVQFQSQLVETGVPKVGFPTYEQFKIVRLHQTLENLLPQYRVMDGTNNIWIVKPSYNARGVGIYCTRQLRDILKDKEMTQQKVVQKYIERPFCIDGLYKFDFRQWVLVNSWEPLDVCVFSSAYLKLCGSVFDLKQLNDVYRHLSNYSIQKENGEKLELVMSSRQFEEFIQKSQTGKESFSWKNGMLPKINDVVWRTLKSVQENIEQKQNCFEVYGFDIVLDVELNPWVIEVNLSPACSERAEWLTTMLDDSCLDLLTHIQSRILTANPAESWSSEMAALREQAIAAPHRTTKDLNPKSFYEEKKLEDRWIRLDESIKEIKEFQKVANLAALPAKGLQLEVLSMKADLRYERKLDRGYRLEMGAIEIQRLFRGHLGRRKFTQRLRQKSAIIIQKNVRVLLAKYELRRLRQKRAATIVQKQLRRRIAQKRAAEMEAARILQLKIEIVTKLQTRYRMRRDKAQVHSVRQDLASRRCQKHLRGYLARKKVKKVRDRQCLIVRIQRFIKKRFRLKQKSAIIVQKLLKGFTLQKKAKKLLKIQKGSIKLLSTMRKGLQKRTLRILRRNAKAIKVQSIFRMVRQRKHYKLILRTRALQNSRLLFKKFCLQQLCNFAKHLREKRDQCAIIVQKRMRSYLASRKVKQLAFKAFLDRQATTIKRFMRGYLGKKEAKRRRIKIGAAIMIQSLWRGFFTRKEIKCQRMWQEEQELNELGKKMRPKGAKRNSDMGQYTSIGGLQSQSLIQKEEDFSPTPEYPDLINKERGKRYSSNPATKFCRKNDGEAQKSLKKNGSQGSMVPSQSHRSLRRIEAESEPYTSNKFQSQACGGNKKRTIVKKGGKSSVHRSEKEHFEIGMRHLAKLHQTQNSDKQTNNQANTAVFVGSNTKRLTQEQKQKLRRVQKIEAVPARLGSKIASGLQRQKVEQLISEGSQIKNMPLKQEQLLSQIQLARTKTTIFEEAVQRNNNFVKNSKNSENLLANPAQCASNIQSFDQKLNQMIKDTIQERQIAIDKNQKQNEAYRFSSSMVDTSIVCEPSESILHQMRQSISFDTKYSETVIQGNSGIHTPVAMSVKSINSKQLNREVSQNKLKTQRSGKFLQPLIKPNKATVIRQSFEQSVQIETSINQKVLAKGLGKEKDVTVIGTTVDKNMLGRGTAQTIVMRKDPSKSSLNSGRELIDKNSQYKQHLALCKQIDSNNLGSSSKLLKKTKENSKHIRNLEKLAQNSNAYLQPMPQPANPRNTITQFREKSTGQHLQQSTNKLATTTNALAGKTTSFAKYLNEMLESQARQQAEEEGSKSKSFASKSSIAGIKLRQPEFKNVLGKNKKDQDSDGLSPLESRNEGQGEGLLSKETSFISREHVKSTLSRANVNSDHLDEFWDEKEDKQRRKSEKSQFATQLEKQQKEIKKSRGPSHLDYNKAKTEFNKTKDNYLEQIKQSQDKRRELVNEAHKKQNNLLNAHQNLLPVQTTLILGRHQAAQGTRDGQQNTQVDESNGITLTEASHQSETSGMRPVGAANLSRSHKNSNSRSEKPIQTNMIVI